MAGASPYYWLRFRTRSPDSRQHRTGQKHQRHWLLLGLLSVATTGSAAQVLGAIVGLVQRRKAASSCVATLSLGESSRCPGTNSEPEIHRESRLSPCN